MAENMALTTVSYLIIRILQNFTELEPVEAPGARDPKRDPAQWPSEATRYNMADGETTFKVGVTMSPREGVWVKLRPTTAPATKFRTHHETDVDPARDSRSNQ